MKPDAAAIQAFVESLPSQPWIRNTPRAEWPRYLFRVDDVQAAASILNSGRLYSRNRAVQLGLLGHDAAAPAVIENSPEWIKAYVRLYFRPRTPTEYRSEGFRPPAALLLGAHRPIPIVFVFNSALILTADGVCFTSGNAASPHAERGETCEFLRSMPFEKVFHEGSLKESEKADVIFRRCAETLVPTELALSELRAALCRSEAERETLLDLLSEQAKASFGSRIGVSAKVHYRQWTFVESVERSNTRITFRFSPNTATPGPFAARADILDAGGIVRGYWMQSNYQANKNQDLDIQALTMDWYRVRLTLDNLLAYSGTFSPTETLL